MAKERRTCKGRKSSGDPCTNWPMHGQLVCHAHGGRAPQAKKAAARRILEAQALELFGRVVEPAPVDNPLAAFAAFAGEVMAWKDLMRGLLEDLSRADYSDETGVEHARAVVELYERAMDRANTVLSSFARLKIDDRLAAITEKQKQTIIRAIEAALEEAGLDGDGMAAAKRTAARHLRPVS
jgi:hypothetical protein